MTDVRPFRGLRYDPARCELSRVIVPPYDVVTPEERRVFWERDPHNAIRLELTKDVADEGTTDYADVGATLAAWQREQVLVRDAQPALYGLRQRYIGPDGTTRVREGFFAALRLESYEKRIVRPYERTLAGPKADRLKLLRATRANLSSVFLLYEDREDALGATLARGFAADPLASARDDGGIEHALYRFDDPALHASVREFLASRPVVIADGHHRYETALGYAEQCRRDGRTPGGAPSDYTLAYFANAYAPGSLLLPIHRVVKKGPAPTDAAFGTPRGLARPRRDDAPASIPALLAASRTLRAGAVVRGGRRLRRAAHLRSTASGDELRFASTKK